MFRHTHIVYKEYMHSLLDRVRLQKKLAKYRAAMHAKEVFIDLVHNLLRTKLK